MSEALLVMIFSDNLKRIIAEKKMTNRYVATRIGVSIRLLYKWKSGLTFPNTKHLAEICDVLNCRLDELFREEQGCSD